MEKFVFYDYETTGISPEYDQPLQFAAIITDLDFNEIERVIFAVNYHHTYYQRQWLFM